MSTPEDGIRALPSPQDYRHAVSLVGDEIYDQGGPRAALFEYRKKYRHSHDFYLYLKDAAEHGLGLEKYDERNNLVDPHHRTANALVSGTIFGLMIIDTVHPRMKRATILSQIQGSVPLTEAQVEEIEGEDPQSPISQRVAYEAISSAALSRLPEESRVDIDSWSLGAIELPDKRRLFSTGCGWALYGAYFRHAAINEKYVLDIPSIVDSDDMV